MNKLQNIDECDHEHVVRIQNPSTNLINRNHIRNG
jgi:hypothetical protein